MKKHVWLQVCVVSELGELGAGDWASCKGEGSYGKWVHLKTDGEQVGRAGANIGRPKSLDSGHIHRLSFPKDRFLGPE
jgi:hypothetical protein